MNQQYVIKWAQELIWAVVFAVAAFALPIILAEDFDSVDDWQTWVTTLAIGSLRVAGATVVNSVRKLMDQYRNASP